MKEMRSGDSSRRVLQRRLGLALLCLAIPACLAAEPQTRPASPTTAPSTRPATAPAGLEQNRTNQIAFEEIPLAEVVEFLRDTYHVNIFVNWKAVESSGVTRNTPISLRARGISLRKALELILTAAGGNPPLAFGVSDGVITISTKQDLESRPETRVYDITDLILPVTPAPGRRDR